MPKYWGYRIDTRQRVFFQQELQEGRLRQGWGSKDEHSLLNDTPAGDGAKRNLSIFHKVKKGDILLIPRLPGWNDVTIAEATEDFSTGYRFEKHPEHNDYRHTFPVRHIKHLSPQHLAVSGNIRKTLKNRSRFWNICKYGKDIQSLIDSNEDLQTKSSLKERFHEAVDNSFADAFDHQKFADILYSNMVEGFQAAEWEYALVEGLKRKFSAPCSIERTGGITEKKHGSDIIIRMPGLLGVEYVIAIQVKDYSQLVGEAPLTQLAKAKWWDDEETNTRLIDKILILTRADKAENQHLTLGDARVIFADDLKALLSELGQFCVGINEPHLEADKVEG